MACLQAALRARPRRAVNIKIPLKSDADLDSIQAKISNGELTIAIPKRVCTVSKASDDESCT